MLKLYASGVSYPSEKAKRKIVSIRFKKSKRFKKEAMKMARMMLQALEKEKGIEIGVDCNMTKKRNAYYIGIREK